MQHLFRLCVVILLCTGSTATAAPTAFERTEERLNKVDAETRYQGAYYSDLMMTLSDYQDTLLAFLYSAESPEAFNEGLSSLKHYDREIRYHYGSYLTWYFNFYAGTSDRVFPHEVAVDSIWGESTAFLNSFKTGRELEAEEREQFFEQERAEFLRDSITQPFALDSAGVDALEPEVLYNFALYPDGTLMVALERPGEKEYHVCGDAVVQAFTHPNHTILAGAPHQALLAAGAFIAYEHEGKRLYFVSSKSGHYQPTYDSLDWMRRWFGEHGVNENTVVPMPDVDMAQHALLNYNRVEVPILVTSTEAERMFRWALDCWSKAYNEIDREALSRLAMGDLSAIDDAMVSQLKVARDEANHMCSAYRLFSDSHTPPEVFHLFVKRFGRLKDAIKHKAYDKVQSEALMVSALLSAYHSQLQRIEITYTSEQAFHDYLQERIATVTALFERDELHMRDYHEVKKIARELGALFFWLAEDNRIEGHHYFLYHAVSTILFDVNKLMADVHAAYVGQELHGGDQAPSDYVVVREKIRKKLLGVLSHFVIEPVHFDLGLTEEFAGKIFDRAAFEWACIHSNIGHASKDEKRGNPRAKLKKLLLQMQIGEITMTDEEIDIALYWAKALRVVAQDTLDLYRLFDKSHGLPDDVANYIEILDRVINDVANEREYLCYRLYEGAWMTAYLSCCSWRSSKADSFHCDDAEGLARSVQEAVSDIAQLVHVEALPIDQLTAIRDRVRELNVVFNLVRQTTIVDHIDDHWTMPKSCYTSMAWRLETLLNILNDEIDAQPDVATVSVEARQLAQYVANKLGD